MPGIQGVVEAVLRAGDIDDEFFVAFEFHAQNVVRVVLVVGANGADHFYGAFGWVDFDQDLDDVGADIFELVSWSINDEVSNGGPTFEHGSE